MRRQDKHHEDSVTGAPPGMPSGSQAEPALTAAPTGEPARKDLKLVVVDQEELATLRTRHFDAESVLAVLVRLKPPLSTGHGWVWARAEAVLQQLPPEVREELGALADEEIALQRMRKLRNST
jgi:hypothetical protein